MATLTLANQADAKTAIEPKTAQLQALLESRRAVWDRMPRDRKQAWIDKGLDPVMTLAWAHYQYLRDFFREVDNG